MNAKDMQKALEVAEKWEHYAGSYELELELKLLAKALLEATRTIEALRRGQ